MPGKCHKILSFNWVDNLYWNKVSFLVFFSFFAMALVLVWVLVHESMSISFGHLFMMPAYL